MEKSIGRHRKRRRGWGEHVRWMIGAVLATVFCGPTSRSAPPTSEPEARQPLPERRARAERQAVLGQQVDEKLGAASRTHAGAVVQGEAAVVPRQRDPYTGRRGWCVDDDGVRGGRPYLARAEERFLCGHAEAAGGAGHVGLLDTVREPSPVPAPSPVPEGGGEGEFAELARLVRRWQAVTS